MKQVNTLYKQMQNFLLLSNKVN